MFVSPKTFIFFKNLKVLAKLFYAVLAEVVHIAELTNMYVLLK